MTGRSVRRGPGPRAERGSTTLEFAALSVALLLLVLLVVQAALYHARNVVKAEAEGAARAVRALPANARADGTTDQVPSRPRIQEMAVREALRQWLVLDNSGDTTTRPQVQGDLVTFDQVRVTVEADPIVILPGFSREDLRIRASAGGPFEVFKRSGQD